LKNLIENLKSFSPSN